MPFKSSKQRKWMHANEPEMAKKWEKKEKMKKETKVKSLIKKMVREIMDEEKLTEKTKRDYKDEYKKFQSSDKSKKYRAELNKYNRDKGTYGNGDGKDASHKGGKIVGFEKESVNRGRAEKSRLKKKTSENVDMNEQKLREMIREVLNESKLNETKYRGYEIKRQNRKNGLPLIIPALQRSASNMKDAKKQIDKFGNKKFMSKNESINEKISKEEWAQYPKYARKLKPYMQKLLKVKLRVGVTKQANHNPFINIRVANFGKDIIPNDFRVKVAKSIGASGVRNWDNVHYGNIQSNSVSLRYDQWVKLTGDLK